MKHFWQFLIIVISWKCLRRRPICFVTAWVSTFHSPAIFAVLHWSFVLKHRTLLCCCLILVTISVGRKSKDSSFWWRSLHEVNMSLRCVLDLQWWLFTYEYLGEYGLNFVKPGNVKLTIGHLLHCEAAPWNCALQTSVPLWIQGLRARTGTHSYHMLRNAGGSGGATGGRVECSCWPSLCHCSPPSLDPVCSTLCSNCHNYLLVRQVILHNFVWHVQCMVHDSWAFGWFNPLFFEPVGTSPHPTIWLTKVGLLSRYGMVSRNRAPQVCREGSSNEPPVLSWARFASCTGQIHDTDCSTTHVRLYPVVSCILGL